VRCYEHCACLSRRKSFQAPIESEKEGREGGREGRREGGREGEKDEPASRRARGVVMLRRERPMSIVLAPSETMTGGV